MAESIDLPLRHDDPIAVEAASFARSLILARVNRELDFYQMISAETTRRSSEGTDGVEGAKWNAALIACLAAIAAVAIIAAEPDDSAEGSAGRATSFLESLAKIGFTF